MDSPQGTPRFYRIAEIHFPSLEALNPQCGVGRSAGPQATLTHPESISTGSKPIFLVPEEETLAFEMAGQEAA